MHFPYSLRPLLRHWSLVLLSLGLALLVGPASGQAQTTSQAYQAYLEEKELKAEKERQQFIQELQQLVDAAMNSGFTEEEIRDITVDRDGKTILVWEFLEQEKIRAERLASQRFEPKDRYLTVTDITEELEMREPSRLDELRQDTTFTGAEQQ